MVCTTPSIIRMLLRTIFTPFTNTCDRREMYKVGNREKQRLHKQQQYAVAHNLHSIHFHHGTVFFFSPTLFIPCGKFGSPYLGKATAAARAALPIPNSACGIFACPDKRYGCQCLESLTSAQMLMPAIAHEGCTDTVKESALKVDSGRKSLAAPGIRTRLGGVPVRGSTSWVGSYIPLGAKDSVNNTRPLSTGCKLSVSTLSTCTACERLRSITGKCSNGYCEKSCSVFCFFHDS